MKKLFSSILVFLLAFSLAWTAEAASSIQNPQTAVQVNGESQLQKMLPIASVMPDDGATGVRPDTQIEISLDEKAPAFKRFQKKISSGKFDVAINGISTESTYDPESKRITVTHGNLKRHSIQEVTLSVKADLKSTENNSNNASYTFSFQTGSAIGEATNLWAEVENARVSTKEEGKVNIKVTDDYGNPATNATVHVTSDSSTLKSNPLVIDEDDNGEGSIGLRNNKAETVNLTITSQDNTYSDAVNKQSVQKVIEFYTPSKLQFRAENILLIQQVLPWESSIWNQTFNEHNMTYTVVDSTKLATVDFSQFDRIVLASDQPQSVYYVLRTRMAEIDEWVANGGVLYFGGACMGWQQGDWAIGPNNIRKTQAYHYTNFVVNTDSPITKGLPESLYYYYASFSILDNLPSNATVLMAIRKNGTLPTTAYFESGNGFVYVTTATIELPALNSESYWRVLWDNTFSHLFLGSK
ncbi:MULTISPECIES: Ig-like domain-containing protein [Bacillus]|uniref:SbsA Ig-like domain-containing protein n=2 Tax=Bacillus TaxID=1386 RepID=A0A0M4FM80_9BACI|nr:MULTISPECIES: Ig-like domain-containing protein [Bacillus]ALC83367.1 hypothetical protein AM592_18765 [Bacillus gobiensis]MBP1084121.1 hypothetical protein [Bacillus capparidis]MED1095563.1 Ig-like domain-containing protein [Bacillus capparidis]